MAISRVLYWVVIYLAPPVARRSPARPTRPSRGAGHTPPAPRRRIRVCSALLRGAVARATPPMGEAAGGLSPPHPALLRSRWALTPPFHPYPAC